MKKNQKKGSAKRHPIKRSKALLLIGVLLLTVFSPSTIQSADAFLVQVDEQVVVNESMVDDFHAIGGKVLIENNIAGDLIVAGGEIKVEGNVREDVMVAGGNVELKGKIGDDVRGIGAQITLSGEVGDDVIVRAGKLIVTKDAVIKGDLIIGHAARVEMNGTVEGDTVIRAASVQFGGINHGNLKIQSGLLEFSGQVDGVSQLAARKIVMKTEAHFKDNVYYWQNSGKLVVTDAMHEKKIEYNPELKFKFREPEVFSGVFPSLIESSASSMRSYAIPFLSAALLISIFGMMGAARLKEAGKSLNRSWFEKALKGLMFLVITPMIAILLMLTIIGLPVGLLILLVYAISLFLSPILTSLVAANWFNQHYKKNWNPLKLFLGSLGFLVALKMISTIPIVGPLAILIAICIAFGALAETRRGQKFGRGATT